VTRVEAARDLSAAKVFVSAIPQPGDEAEDGGARDRLELAAEGLQSAAGFIQSRVSRRVKLRLTPRLHFIADRGIAEGFEMNERIKGLFT